MEYKFNGPERSSALRPIYIRHIEDEIEYLINNIEYVLDPDTVSSLPLILLHILGNEELHAPQDDFNLALGD